MKDFKFSKRSLKILENNVRPNLIAVAHRTLELSTIDFAITSGWRSKKEQEILVNKGKSLTINSRHCLNPSEALDFMVYIEGEGYILKNDILYEQVWYAWRAAGKELGVKLEWGGHWVSFKDIYHVQLKK